MSKIGFINLIDKIFISICVFLLLFAWINYFVMDLKITFILSLIFSFACLYLLFYFYNKKQTKLNLNKQQTKQIEINFLNFKLSSKKEQLNLITNILSYKHKVTKETDYLTYTENENKHVIYLFLNQKILTFSDLINIISNIDADFDKLEIICENYENFNTKILKDKEIILTDKSSLYLNYFSKYNTYPDKKIMEENLTKIKLKDFFLHFFSREKSKGFFICGLILIFSSIIIPYNVYYIIFGSILLIFAIICKVKKQN